MRGFLVPAFGALAVLALACNGGDAPPPQPTPPPTSAAAPTPTVAPEAEVPGPPALVVSIGDASVSAGIGTYCWSGSNGPAVCADAVGVVTPGLALVGQGQPPLTVAVPAAGLTEATATAWRIDERLPCEKGTLMCGALPTEGGLVWPLSRLDEMHELPVRIEGDRLRVVSSLRSGTYVVSLWLTFEERGSVNYGVLMVLLPAEG